MNKFFLRVRTWALVLLLSLSAIAFADNSYGLKDNIQDGVILHCFDWTAAQIQEEIPSIAQAGFTAVQLSPVHQKEGTSAWYMAYQPYDYHIGNSIATTQSLTALCSKAHEYGVKVIVDVVANHTNGNLTYVADRLKSTNLYHDYSGGIDYSNRWQVTHGKIGMWDLKTEDATVQNIIKTYIAELKACGVDGIRWDAAKHIGLPSEGDQFWTNVPDASMYNYGEILDSPYSGDDGTLLKEYAKYICFTDNVYGDGMASSFNSGNVPSSIGCFNQKGVDNSRLVYWGESHDTYSNDGGSSKYISQNNIDKAYAIAAGNNKATSLYFSRPSATDKNAIKMGTKGSTHYTSPEVAEVNHMHNLCAGEANYYVHENGVGAQLRKSGAVFVLGSGQSGSVNIANGNGSWLAPGTYTDKVGGGTFTVTASNITGQISKSGIAVIYSGTISKGSIAISPAGGSFTSDTQTVTLTGTDTKSIYYTIGNGAKQTTTSSTVSFTIGADMAYGESVTVTYGGTNTDGEAINENTATFTKQDATATVNVYLKNDANWAEPIYCYAYSKDEKRNTGAWPGAKMTLDATTGYYTLDLTSYDLEDAYCIFYSASGRYPGDMEKGLDNSGTSKLFNNSTRSWTDYTPTPIAQKPVVTMPESQTFSTKPFAASISVTNATSAYYTVNGGAQVSFSGSTTVPVYETSTIKVSATNASGTTEKSATYTYATTPPPSTGDLASYYKTNPNGYGQKKTVSSYTDFTLSDIIAQGAANDDPRVYRPNSMYEVPIDLYALYGAYDDTNLYLAWDMTNVQDVVAPSDDYPLSQGILYQTMNVPFMLLFDTQDGGGNGCTDAAGSTIWNTGITYPSIVNRVVMCSTNAANGPYVYENNGTLINEKEIYDAATSGINFKVSNFGVGIKSSTVYGINGAYGENNGRVVGDIKSGNESNAAWVDFNTKGHKSSSLDFHYYMAIPLSTLGTSASQIESRGLGIMIVATMGKSGMDCLPYDLSMNDNADQADTESQEFNSYEKSDADNITAAFAYLGKSVTAIKEIGAGTKTYNGLTNVYSLSGTLVRTNVPVSNATNGLASGVYIMKNAQGKYNKVFVE